MGCCLLTLPQVRILENFVNINGPNGKSVAKVPSSEQHDSLKTELIQKGMT